MTLSSSLVATVSESLDILQSVSNGNPIWLLLRLLAYVLHNKSLTNASLPLDEFLQKCETGIGPEKIDIHRERVQRCELGISQFSLGEGGQGGLKTADDILRRESIPLPPSPRGNWQTYKLYSQQTELLLSRVVDILKDAVPEGAGVSLLGEVYENLIAHPKTQGAYYTPGFITKYIVEKTIGPLLQDKSPDGLLDIKILDPAMGAGAFLLEALNYLESAVSNMPEPSQICKCLYGADIDPLAVDAARLSVWIAAGCRVEYSLLKQNLQCKDSLLEDWTESYDAIIGNPPYLFGERIPTAIRNNKSRFHLAKGQFDIYWLFYELVMGKLLKDGGYHGFIVPDAIFARDETACIREPITRKWRLLNLVKSGPVFGNASVSGAVVIWRKFPADMSSACVETGQFEDSTYTTLHEMRQQALSELPNCRWLVGVEPELIELISRLSKVSRPLGDIAKISRGEEFGKSALYSESENGAIPILAGNDVISLGCSRPSRYISGETVQKKLTNYASPKIVLVKTGKRLVASVDLEDTLTLQSIYNIQVTGCDIWYVCGLLSSELINQIIGSLSTDHKQIFPQLNQTTVASIPIPIPEPSDSQGLEMATAISKAAKEAHTASPERRADLKKLIDEILASSIKRLL